jgi:hypothetical protein
MSKTEDIIVHQASIGITPKNCSILELFTNHPLFAFNVKYSSPFNLNKLLGILTVTPVSESCARIDA